MIRKRIIGSVIRRLMMVSVSTAVMFAVSVFSVSAATTSAPAQENSTSSAAVATTTTTAAQQKISAPAKVPVIDTSKSDELRSPVNSLKENVLKTDLVTKGTQYDAAGLLTYSIQNGSATIMSCDPAVQGELYIPDYINGCPVTAINDYAFLYCANLTAVTLPATVTDIGDYAFCYCTQLASVTAGGTASGSISVGDHAFYRCYDLKKLDYGVIGEIGNYAFAYSGLSMTSFADGLKTIGAYAFEGCSSLTVLTLPDSLVTIGDFAFESCENITHVTFPPALDDSQTGGYIFYSCKSLKDITPSIAWRKIPDGIFAKCNSADPYCLLKEGMTEIGSAAFYWCPGVKESLVIPSTVTRIGSYAVEGSGARRDGFMGTAISSINFPDGLKYIGTSAFKNAHLENGIDIPDSVEEIGASAFEGTSLMGKLKLPSSLKTLGGSAFADNALTDINISAELKSVGDGAFQKNTQLKSVNISSGSDSTDWGSSVFFSCTALESVELPSSWTRLPAAMFADCTSLTSVNIPNGVTAIEEQTFSRCRSLKNITLPSSVKTIGDLAFQASGLESINIQNGLEEVGKNAFYGTKLKSLVLPGSVKSISETAFKNCTELVTVEIRASNLKTLEKSVFEGCLALKSVYIADGVEHLKEDVFKGCSLLESVRLPSTLKYIGDTTSYFNKSSVESGSSCFSDCKSLSSIELPEGILFIGDHTFSNCTSLKSIKLPKSLEFMGQSVFKNAGLERVTLADDIREGVLTSSAWFNGSLFAGCSKLKSINIPSSWKSIPKGFLYKCTGSLGSLVIPSNITTIEESAFQECTGLTSVTIPDSVKVIGKKAFYGTGLTSLTIPDSVTQENLGEYAVGGCKNLKAVKLPLSWTKLPDGLFQNNVSLTDYTVGSNFTEIGKSAFAGSMIKSITLPESITVIGDEAFKECKQLSAVKLPSKLEKIGESAFDGCSSITEIVIPGGVKEISPLAFASCSSLKRAVIQSGTRSIDGMAFGYCDSLQEVVVPDSVVNVGYCAFYGSNPGVLTLTCSKDSAADKHAHAVLYLNSTYHKKLDGVSVVYLYPRSLFDTEGKLYHGAYYYDVEYNGLRYHVECDGDGNAKAGGWRKNYSQSFFASVKSIADAYKNNYNTSNVTIDAYLAGSSVPIKSIGADVFSGQNSIKTVKLGTNISSIGNRAFSNCKNLVSVDMSQSGLKSIGGAFEGCTSLTKILWPAAMETVEKYAFKGCSALKSLDFTGTKLKYIYQDAFSGCSSLSSLKLREGVKWIDDNAFSKTAIKDAYLPASMEILQPTAFDGKKTTYHFTGDATAVNYYWTDEQHTVHYDPVLPLILEERFSRVSQFFGNGLDNQTNYWISTGTAGLNVPYGMQSAAVVFGEMGVPVGDTASELSGDLSTQSSGDTAPDSITPEEPDTEQPMEDKDITQPENEKVYEVVKKKVADNPWMLGLAGLITAALAALGGLRRYRKSR